jgi:hypothetical protein
MIAAVLVVCAFALVLAAMVSFVVRSAISTEPADLGDAVEIESWRGIQGLVVLRRLAGGLGWLVTAYGVDRAIVDWVRVDAGDGDIDDARFEFDLLVAEIRGSL